MTSLIKGSFFLCTADSVFIEKTGQSVYSWDNDGVRLTFTKTRKRYGFWSKWFRYYVKGDKGAREETITHTRVFEGHCVRWTEMHPGTSVVYREARHVSTCTNLKLCDYEKDCRDRIRRKGIKLSERQKEVALLMSAIATHVSNGNYTSAKSALSELELLDKLKG